MPRQKTTIRPPAPRPAPPKSAPPPRGIVSNVAGFGRAFASGVKNIVVGTAQGAVSLAKGGYALATNPQARTQAMQTGRAIANGVKGYAGQAYKDPKKALRDAQAGVNSMYNQFNSARKAAAAKGQSAEFWGNASAEIGSMLVPGGALAKGARGATALSVASKAKNIIMTPIVKAAKSLVSVLPCGKIVSSARTAAGKITSTIKPRIQSATQFARSQQGLGNYPGIDRYREITLKKGTVIVQGAGGNQTPFFMPQSAIRKSGGSKTKLFQGLQVAPHPTKGYRNGVTYYVVQKDTKVAFGRTLKNPQHGKGGLGQIVVRPQDLKNLNSTHSLKLK